MDFKGIVVNTTEICRSWTKIVQYIKETHEPVLVLKRKRPEVVVMSYEDFLILQEEINWGWKEACGKKMVADLIEIAELENKPIPHMQLDKNGVFRKT
ncbi:hypothetical protein APD05_11825 [Acinetobacter nosocomialis]|uniref:type II toxin-antitoxin system Phd/YefM family antitoxin n=1 Tax=Acinetobacter TaxID=469 RepID=UPI00046DD2E5|nr:MULTISPECIES: type II toxin-antitoxin system Phd/YefM family antitoxin [Acinetobacter]KQD11371.1 hypothetical protein APD05_11825 [Acinetobacter nosocomialis]MCU4575700.1 type II toxin-antitoxin system Phd/YefM family antitoxin [Acinetobacter nosocomialis]MCU4594186.1 type II toxin-antitoxin system Phd/YefM family antitoxin [Acinetobacter nosocomialis]MDU5774185.1 type II toxin-antitoxin system Phd/YefM family antitoxin [Acinetobacter sp.]